MMVWVVEYKDHDPVCKAGTGLPIMATRSKAVTYDDRKW